MLNLAVLKAQISLKSADSRHSTYVQSSIMLGILIVMSVYNG